MNLEHHARAARHLTISTTPDSSPTTRALADILSAVLDHLIAENADEGPSNALPADIARPAASRRAAVEFLTRRGPPPGVTDPTTLALEALTKERDAAWQSRDEVLRKANSDVEQLSKNLEQSELNARQAVEHLTERLNEQVRQRGSATKRAQLADAEWNAARVALNPLIAPEFGGQSLADAVTHTIQMLEAKLKHATEAGQRAHDDANRIQKVLATSGPIATAQLDKLRRQKAGHLSTIADLARQNAELRQTLADARSQHPADLARQRSTWELARQEGAEQVRRLQIENQEQRVELHKFRSAAMMVSPREHAMQGERDEARKDRDRIMGLLSSATTLIEGLGRMFGVTGTSREVLVEAVKDGITDARATIGKQAAACTAFRERVLQLEEQLARSHKLTELVSTQSAELRDRVQTIADEAFGPFPVLATDEALTAIEQGITRQRGARRLGDRFVDVIRAWIDNERGLDGVREALAAFDKDRAEAQAKDEAEQLEFMRTAGGAPDPDEAEDCQRGTCDCGEAHAKEIVKLVSDAAAPSADPPLDF